MRKKIEELRNKEEGFTLVELLAVIVILGIIVAIAIPAVGSVIDRADSGATAAEQDLVEDAARLYVTTNSESVSWDDNDAEINVEDLYEEGYLEDRSTESGSNNKLTGTVKVERTPLEQTKGENNFTYEYDASEVKKPDA